MTDHEHMKVRFIIELLREVQGNYTLVTNSFMRKSIMQRLGIFARVDS
jgi:hypothetical protein